MKPKNIFQQHTHAITASMLAIAITSGVALPASAAENESSVSGSLTLVSNYIWRGQSQTWGGPALQLSLEASHPTGLYAGFFASNVSKQWVPGASLETDWYAGFRNTVSDISYDLNLNYAWFPGGNFNKTGFMLPSSSPNTVEVSATVSYRWLSVKTGQVLTKFYGWDTTNSGPGGFAGDPLAGVTGSTKGSWFVQADANYPLAEDWTLSAQLGHQTIRNSTGLSWSYYKAGVNHSIGDWQLGLSYSAGSEPAAFKNFVGLTNNGSTYSAARPAVVLSIGHAL